MVCNGQWPDKSGWEEHRGRRNTNGNKAWGVVGWAETTCGGGVNVIQIVDPGFMGDLSKGTKLGQQEKQIPDDPGGGRH